MKQIWLGISRVWDVNETPEETNKIVLFHNSNNTCCCSSGHRRNIHNQGSLIGLPRKIKVCYHRDIIKHTLQLLQMSRMSFAHSVAFLYILFSSFLETVPKSIGTLMTLKVV